MNVGRQCCALGENVLQPAKVFWHPKRATAETGRIWKDCRGTMISWQFFILMHCFGGLAALLPVKAGNSRDWLLGCLIITIAP